MSTAIVKPQYLVRIWGRDSDGVKVLRTPETIETDGALCYWFPTPADRQAFIASIPDTCWVVRAQVNPGEDRDGELINTHARTIASIVLRLPDGQTGSFEQDFGYGYPIRSVHFMWEEGNYACDCNKRLFLARECNIGIESDDPMCGDKIELVSLTIRQVED